MIFDRPAARPRGWLLLLALLLAVGEPLALAQEVARLLPSLGMRGPAVILLVVARVVITGLAVAAGLAILGRRPHAVGMAKLALVLLAAVSLFSVLTPILPTNRLPGTTGPVTLVIAAYYGAWLVYLYRSRHDT
jgi:hypothetical protein